MFFKCDIFTDSFDGSIKHKGVMIKQHKSKSLTSNYKKYSFVSKIMVCQSDSGGKVCKTQRYEFPGTLVVGEMDKQ